MTCPDCQGVGLCVTSTDDANVTVHGPCPKCRGKGYVLRRNLRADPFAGFEEAELNQVWDELERKLEPRE